jgi:hypothetical protein
MESLDEALALRVLHPIGESQMVGVSMFAGQTP